MIIKYSVNFRNTLQTTNAAYDISHPYLQINETLGICLAKEMYTVVTK